MNNYIRQGGLWVWTQNALTLAALALGPVCGGRSWHWSWRAFGLSIFVLGAVFGIAGVRALGRSRTPYPRPLQDAPLVQKGIYRVVRHPLYSSLVLATLGWSLLWSSTAALAVSLGLAVLLDAKSRREDRWLSEKFPEYPPYRRRVRRFIPWIY